jgi:hypothetical protein
MVAGATLLLAGQAIAADMPYYPPVIEIPDVDYGYAGSFYLRGSVAGNVLTGHEYYPGCPGGCAGAGPFSITQLGYGYSFGAGVGYETGTSVRADVTLDHGYNSGAGDATYSLGLRSTILLANAYYDFPLGGGSGAAGGFGAYVGAGVGGAYLQTTVTGGLATPDGNSWAPAAALMAGVTYDMGAIVADLGYRGIYMPQITNAQIAPNTSFYANHALTHELRATMRYRFN